MKYKLYVSGYIEETQQLLVSFSSDDTSKEASDYQSLAFDVVPYGDVPAHEVLNMIAKVAPTVCSDIVTQETYTDDSLKAQQLRGLVGRTFEYEEGKLVPPSGFQRASEGDESVEAETL